MPASNALAPDYAARVARLRQTMNAQGYHALLVSSRENIRYLVGFAGSAGWVVVSDDDLVLVTDSRYIGQASAQMPCGRVELATTGLADCTAGYATECDLERIAFEADDLTVSSVRSLESCLQTRGHVCELISTSGLVEVLREVKDVFELDAVRRAAALADGAVRHARRVMKLDMTEEDLAWRLERWLREHGSGAMPFDIIVASGPNAALPHAVPSRRPLREGEPVVIDLGARVDGYCSDITRTLFLNRIDAPFESIYREVLSAQVRAIDGLTSGMAACGADALARRELEAVGFGAAFTHGLGHGVGLEIHERPTVNSRSTGLLLDGMVFTVEPGVYVSGQGGVRIEDTVVLQNGRSEQLTRADKGDPVVVLRR